MNKPIKFAIAVYLVNPNNENEFLAVKRPPTDDRLPNVWGLPAYGVEDNSLPEDVVRIVGKDKLNTEIESIEYIGIKYADRGDYTLILADIKAKLVGQEPSVTEAPTTRTKYVDQQWTSDFNILKEAASKGSLCSQIILDKNNITY